MKVTFQVLQSDAEIMASLDAGQTVVDAHHTKKLICSDDATWQELTASFLEFLSGVYGYDLLPAVAFINPDAINSVAANVPFFLIEDEL